MDNGLVPVERFSSNLGFPIEEDVKKPSEDPVPSSSKARRNWVKKKLNKANKKRRKEEAEETKHAKSTDPEEGGTEMTRENLLLGPEEFDLKPRVLEPDLGFAWREVRDNKIKVNQIKLITSIIRANLVENGISTLLPVQSEVIPWLISSRTRPVLNDLCVSYPTGSGKTLAYAVPVIQYLMNRYVPRIRALVLLPVQELAQQVFRVFHTFAKGTDVRIALSCGSQPLAVERSHIVRKNEDEIFETLPDILVITPGRLVEHIISTEGFTLAFLNYLIIDEADRLLSNTQNQWLYVLKRHLKEEKEGRYSDYELPRMQKCLFSATLTKDPEILKPLQLDSPVYFSQLSKEQIKGQIAVPSQIEENYIIVDESQKPLVALYFGSKWGKCVCFCNSNKEAERLALLFKSFQLEGYEILEYSYTSPKAKRDEVLKKFELSRDIMLVTCDRMARGIDIPGVKNVILYNSPKDFKGYVHRIGRTGRAGESGRSLTLVKEKQQNAFLQLLQSSTSKPSLINVDEADLQLYKDLYKKAKERFNTLVKDLEKLEKTNEKLAKAGNMRKPFRKRVTANTDGGEDKKKTKRAS